MARFITFAVSGEGNHTIAVEDIIGIAQDADTTTLIFQKGGLVTTCTHADDSSSDNVYTELLAGIEAAQAALKSPHPSKRDVEEKNITLTTAVTAIASA